LRISDNRSAVSWELFVLVALTPLLVFMLCACKTGHSETAPVVLRVMTYNIQHGAGADNKIDLLRTAEAINHEKPDIVALEEVDRGVARTDGRDLPAELAALTGMTSYFSNNFHFQGGEYGNAVLSRLPILYETNSHYHMIRTNEQRGIIQLVLDAHGRKLLFMATHIDYRADDTERLLNVDEIRRLPDLYPGLPVILCGDFNDLPGRRVHKKMKERFIDTWQVVGQGEGHTYSSIAPKKRIDYIWISPTNAIMPLRAWVPQTQASDHFPLVADFQIK
jgi:endonuclease/exonuclease/phosphatase family metal-dependent hydrolase